MHAVRSAFAALIDYAGLFPPARLPMADAVREYRRERLGPFAWMLGRFIVPASRFDELREDLAEGEVFSLSAIVDAGADARAWFARMQKLLVLAAHVRDEAPNVRIAALEVPLPPPLSRRETYDAPIAQYVASCAQSGFQEVPSYVELPRTEDWEDRLRGAMLALKRRGVGTKIRCGGETAQAFPPSRDVATFIAGAVDTGIPFKATAGLHHPLPRRDGATGFRMHGFLNLLTATALARRKERLDELVAILDDGDPRHFHFDSVALYYRDREIDADALRAARESFVAYGSCSFAEPTQDLIGLGMLSDAG